LKHKFNPDEEFAGFKIRTRYYYCDHSVVREILGNEDSYRLPNNPKLVVDIGANIGLVSLVMARRGAEVYAYEPESDNYETLLHNVWVNGYGERVRCIREAVGNPKNTKLYVHPKASGCTSFFTDFIGGFDGEYQTVKTVSIHDVFKDKGYCDLLKIDCEGSEKDIINDFDDGLAGKVGQISVEIHDKKLLPGLVEKLSKWYDAECTDNKKGRIYIFKKKHGTKS